MSNLFSPLYGHAIFSATMSIYRFWFLCRNLSFDAEATWRQRWPNDRFAALREIFELFNENCAKLLIPDDYLSLDETLYPTHVGVSFRQFNKSKPTKYGLLFRSINSAQMPYSYTAIAYAGMPTGIPSEYYLSGTDEYMKALINRLSLAVSIQGRNLSIDHFYTSIDLARWCLDKKVTLVGTMQSNQRGVGDVASLVGHGELSTKVFWEEKDGKMSLTSYVAKQSQLESAMSLCYVPC